jgi:hypothetical protein
LVSSAIDVENVSRCFYQFCCAGLTFLCRF